MPVCLSAIKDWMSTEEEWKKAIKYEKEAKERQESTEVSENQLHISLVVQKRPVAYRAHKSLGRLYLDNNLTEKALEEFERAIKLEPSDPEPYYELGRIYQKREEFKKAIFCFEKYLYLGGKKEPEVKGYLILMKNKNKK